MPDTLSPRARSRTARARAATHNPVRPVRSHRWSALRSPRVSRSGPARRPPFFMRCRVSHGWATLGSNFRDTALVTFRCRTRATDPVFIRSACVRTRPNAPIPLTVDTVIRDREGAARIHSARYAAHAVSLSGGAMVRRAYRQRSLVEVLLPDGDKLWDPTLRQIDTLLDDDVLIDRVTEALAQRHPQSQRRGRLGTPATVVLRMLVLKHLSDWTFDECEREVRGSLVYRAFCRIDGERVPGAKPLIRLARLLDEPVLKDVLARLVALGRERHVVRGRRLRVDTTVVETNIHYPTDATLLADGVRVLTRGLRRIGE